MGTNAWFAEHGLLGGAASVKPSAADVRHAVALREALRAHLDAHHGEPLDASAATVLDAAARRAMLTVRFPSDETALMKVCGNRAKVRGFRERTRSGAGE